VSSTRRDSCVPVTLTLRLPCVICLPLWPASLPMRAIRSSCHRCACTANIPVAACLSLAAPVVCSPPRLSVGRVSSALRADGVDAPPTIRLPFVSHWPHRIVTALESHVNRITCQQNHLSMEPLVNGTTCRCRTVEVGKVALRMDSEVKECVAL
jgi:hypothetical protein